MLSDLGPGPAVPVLEPHDVLEVRRRDLDDRRVLDTGDAMDGPGLDPERGPRADDLRPRELSPGAAISILAWPECTNNDSSFRRRNWRLSDSPALTNRILPT